MLGMNSNYHPPQIQRLYLIPLAQKFFDISLSSTSVEEFCDFIIRDKSTNCTKNNIKLWKKDAGKALRFITSQKSIESSLNESLPVKGSTLDSPKVDISMDDSNRVPPRKRSRLVHDNSAETIPVRTPSLRLSDIKSTTPLHLRREIKYFLKSHISFDSGLPIWPTLLVNGPPFCGKSTLIEAVCGSLGIKLMTVSVGTIPSTMRSWMDIFNQARSNTPCVLHLDDLESMEKQSPPVGTFRLTCLLKSQILKELIRSNVVVVGETRCLLASLPQSILDLFTQKITFGMLAEHHRLNLLNQYLLDDCGSSEFFISNMNHSLVPKKLQLTEGLTCLELARRTPGYEIGDLIRLIAQLRLSCLSNDPRDSDEDESDFPETTNSNEKTTSERFTIESQDNNNRTVSMDHDYTWSLSSSELIITRALVDHSLAVVVPAVKNTPEFVTIPNVTWADVGGLDTTKTELYNRFMLLIDDWERAKALNRRSGGVLLEGPPGCGKTLVAKALSNQAGLNFLSVKGPEVLNKFQGESERRIREIFERARACQPCLVFFDEIDAICPKRDSDESTGSRVSLVNQLLVELDGIDKHRSARVFVVGATNRKDMIDPAVLRPGRLGLHLLINPPANSHERLSVLSACTSSATVPRIEGGLQSLELVANDPRTVKMSGADLENLLELAKQKAQLYKQDYVSVTNLFDALTELRALPLS